MNPSNQPSSRPTSEPSSSPSFNLYFVRQSFPLPEIISIDIVPLKYSFQITLKFSTIGKVFCALYHADSIYNKPKSLNDFKFQANVARISYEKKLNVIRYLLNLVPSTKYYIYFLTQSITGFAMTLDQVLANSYVATTICCKSVSSYLSVSSFYQNYIQTNVLKITLEALPTIELVVHIQLYDTNNTNTHNSPITVTFLPASVSFRNDSLVKYFYASLPGLPSGLYKYQLELSGPSANEYNITYSNSPYIKVLGINDIPPTPKLQSAWFADDGSYINIKFDSNTNKGNLPNIFPCNLLFDFVGVFRATCQWVDNTIIHAYSVQTLKPNNFLSLLNNNNIQATCYTASKCSAYYPTATAITIHVSAPLSAIAPVVSIITPDEIGSCDDLIIDITGSTGSGGRMWKNSTIRIAQRMNSSVINKFLETQSSYFPIIPRKYLSPGSIYIIIVQICNFLNACGTLSKTVYVLDSLRPSVLILGSSSIIINRKDLLFISSNAFVTTCDGSISRSNLIYQWSINVPKSIRQEEVVISKSKDPAKYLLDPYTLQVDTFYDIKLLVITSATLSDSSTNATTSVTVYVAPGQIRAVLSGGTLQNMRESETIYLDASQSYDEDIQYLTGFEAKLKYSWTCIQISPILVLDCYSIFDKHLFESTKNDMKLTLKALYADVDTHITLIVTDEIAIRSSTININVHVLPLLSASISMKVRSLTATNIINAGNPLQFVGTLSTPPGIGGYANWVVDDSNIHLESISLSPLSSIINPNISSSSILYLSLDTSSFIPGSVLTFSLVGSLSMNVGSKDSIASIAITINSAPQPGKFIVTPTDGVELSTSFLFSALQWIDIDLPLTYQFGYISNTDINLILISKSLQSFGSTKLTAGNSANNYIVTCIGRIFDNYNAMSITENIYIIVKYSQTILGSTQVTDTINKIFSDVSTPDSIKQCVAVANYVLGTDICVNAPNCMALHRQNCSRTAHTCGPCESDAYIGVDGDSNEPCVAVTLSVANLNNTDVILKPCPGNCFDHGNCTYIQQDSGVVLSSEDPPCVNGNMYCKAVCICDADYYGSDTCELSTVEFKQRQMNRALIIKNLKVLVTLENPDDAVLEGWINLLLLTSQMPSELTFDTSTDILSIANTIISTDSSLPTTTLNKLLNLVNAVTHFIQNMQFQNILHNRNNSNDISHLFNKTSSTIDSYSTLIASRMLPQQQPVQYITDNFRLSVQVVGNNDQNAVELSIPQTLYELYRNQSASYITIPFISTSNNNNSTKDVTSSIGNQVIIKAIKSGMYNFLNEDFKSNPITLSMSSSPCTNSTSNCTIEVVIPNSQSYDVTSLYHYRNNRILSSSLDIGEYHSISCGYNDYSNHIVTCKSGLKLTLQCQGTASIVTNQCPLTKYTPVCNALLTTTNNDITLHSSSSSSGCHTTTYTNNTISCSCDLQTSLVQSNYGYSAGYVSMLRSVTVDFSSTIESTTTLDNKVWGGWRAFVAIFIVITIILISLYFAHNADEKMKKVIPETIPNIKSTIKKAKLTRRSAINDEVSVVDSSLPSILSSHTLSDRLIDEIKHHHRWLGVVFYYTEDFPRVLRVASLATNMVIMLFVQSLTYNLVNPDDGSCKGYQSEQTCVAPKSDFDTGESKCAWITHVNSNNNEAADSYCEYIQPDGSIRVILFVAIFCAIVTTPIALLVDMVILHILAAPTYIPEVSSDIVIENKKDSILEKNSSIQLTITSSNLVLKKTIQSFVTDKTSSREDNSIPIKNSRNEFTELLKGIRNYRDSLSIQQKHEFDIIWGLDEDGFFRNEVSNSLYYKIKSFFNQKNSTSISEIITMELQNIYLTVEEEHMKFQQKTISSTLKPNEIGKRLLFLFQCDLLPGINGQILIQKGNRDAITVKHITRNSKILAWIFLGVLNILMLFYILLVALTQTSNRQSAWFKSFITWLLVEVVVVSTIIVVITHICIPLLIMKDITKIKFKLVENIKNFQDKIQSKNIIEAEETKQFNAAEYLFISTRLAKLYPYVKEAQMIAQFITPWPKQSYQHIATVSQSYSKKFSAFTRSISIIVIYFIGNFITMPTIGQDIITQMASTGVIGYIIWLHIQLYDIYPALIIVPVLIIGIIIHFILVSSKIDVAKRYAKISNQAINNIWDKRRNNNHLTRRESIQEGMDLVDALHQQKSSENDDNSDGIYSCKSSSKSIDLSTIHNHNNDDDDSLYSYIDSLSEIHSYNEKNNLHKQSFPHSNSQSINSEYSDDNNRSYYNNSNELTLQRSIISNYSSDYRSSLEYQSNNTDKIYNKSFLYEFDSSFTSQNQSDIDQSHNSKSNNNYNHNHNNDKSVSSFHESYIDSLSEIHSVALNIPHISVMNHSTDSIISYDNNSSFNKGNGTFQIKRNSFDSSKYTTDDIDDISSKNNSNHNNNNSSNNSNNINSSVSRSYVNSLSEIHKNNHESVNSNNNNQEESIQQSSNSNNNNSSQSIIYDSEYDSNRSYHDISNESSLQSERSSSYENDNVIKVFNKKQSD